MRAQRDGRDRKHAVVEGPKRGVQICHPLTPLARSSPAPRAEPTDPEFGRREQTALKLRIGQSVRVLGQRGARIQVWG